MRNYTTGILIKGDSKGGVKATKAQEDALKNLNKTEKKAEKQSKSYSRQLKRTSRSAGSFAGAIKSAIIPLAGLATLGGAITTLASFSQEMSTLEAIAGSGQIGSLRKEIESLGSSTRFSATQAAQGATFLARAGFDSNEILQSLSGTLQLAQAGALELGAAADIASNVLQGFRLSADETARVVDVLALAANSSNTNVEQLGGAMSFVAPISAALTVSIEQTAAAIGALSDAGIQGERAGTGLRAIFVELESAGGDLSVQAHGLSAVLKTLRDRQLSLSEAADLVGKRQAASLLVLIDSIDKVDLLTESYENAEGTAARVAKTMDDNLNAALVKVGAKAEAVVIQLGNLGAEDSLTQGLLSLAGGLEAVAENADVLADAIIVLSVAGLSRALIPRIGLAVADLRTMAATTTLAATATKGLNGAMAVLGGPVGVAVTAAAAMYLYIDSLETADERTGRLKGEIEELNGVLRSSGERDARLALLGYNEQLVAIQEEIGHVIARQTEMRDLQRAGLPVDGLQLAGLQGELDALIQKSEELELKAGAAQGALVGALRDEVSALADELGNLQAQELPVDQSQLAQIKERYSELVAELKSYGVEVEALNVARQKTVPIIQALTTAEQSLLDTLFPLKKAERERAEQVEILTALQKKGELGSLSLADALVTLAKAEGDVGKAQKARVEELDKLLEKEATQLKLEQDLIDRLDPITTAQREFSDELSILNSLYESGELSAERYGVMLRNLQGEYVSLHPEIARSQQAAADWADAWREATSRIDESFAGAWRGAFDSFSGFADSLLDSFKNLLGELAHQAITKPILVRFTGEGAGGAGGGFNFSQVTSSIGGLFDGGFSFQNLGNTVGGLFGGGGGGGSNAGTSAASLFSQFAAGGGSGTATGGTGAAAGAGVSGAVAGGIFAAIVGIKRQIDDIDNGVYGVGQVLSGQYFETKYKDYLNDKIPGAGSIVAEGIKAFHGNPLGLLDGLFDFGFGPDGKKRFAGGVIAGDAGNPRNIVDQQRGASGLLLTGVSNRIGDGGKSSQEFLDSLLEVDDLLTNIATNAGLSVDFTNTVLQGRSGQAGGQGSGAFFGAFGFNGNNQGTDPETAAAEFVNAWVDEIGDQLPRRVRDIIGSVTQTAGEIVGAFEAGLQIDSILESNALARLNEELAESQKPLLAQYDELVDRVITTSSELDGSAASLSTLAQALTDQQNAAVTLAAAYHSLSSEIDSSFSSFATQIRESILSDEELYTLRQQQIADLTVQLRNTVDPGEIGSITGQAEQFSRDAFGLLDESQRTEMAEEFAQTLDGINALAQSRIDEGLESLESRDQAVRDTVDFEISNRHQDAANTQLQAAETSMQAAQLIAQAAAAFASGSAGQFNFDLAAIQLRIGDAILQGEVNV